jgi:uncharacterized protein (DUF608 family)
MEKIGMPVGGICAGQLYLGGDGKLWHWDIFNQEMHTGDGNYAHPPQPDFPLEQGFALRLTADGQTRVRTLDTRGFPAVSFRGEYPIGYVEYRDPDCPVAVRLEAFSPFIPLDADSSSLPATILQFTVKNTGSAAVEAEMAGWLENVIGRQAAAGLDGVRKNRVLRTADRLAVECSAESRPEPATSQERKTIVLADFEGETYGDWTVEGQAFGRGPAHGPANAGQHLKGFLGKGLVNSYPGSDAPTGKLTSPTFTIQRRFICFLIGGGNHPQETCINLLVDGKVVRSSTGKDSDAMEWDSWHVDQLEGRTARIEIVDNHTGGWGHIDIDQIEMRDKPRRGGTRLADRPDFGTMVLALLEPRDTDQALAAVPAGRLPEAVFSADEERGQAHFSARGLSRFSSDENGTVPLSRGPKNEPVPKPLGEKPQTEEPQAEKPLSEKLLGAIRRRLSLQPGQTEKITFLVSWHFPNLALKDGGRYYATRFSSAGAVADYVARHFERLAGQTRLWHDTWYDSTLPYWFLDRTFLNTSILATSTCHRFRTGRFYGWEGVGCCDGTCTHVWHYAHAVARLFPELERDLRRRTDFGLAQDPTTGIINHRGEGAGLAVDGQAGCILRAYREHQMSADGAMLKELWPKIKLAMQCLVKLDRGAGLVEGPQHNTLDQPWFGKVAWLSSLYLAALRACEEMAREVGDADFARQTADIFQRGAKSLDRELFNGEYYYHVADKAHLKSVGSHDGCEIDQAFGQSWAFQVGLGRILPEEHARQALASLWKYNFTPDVGPYRQAHRPGRWYAMPGEGGLLMCTWPHGEKARVQQGYDYYFNECMTGFEYQAAGHMIWEGMLEEGLAVCRAIHDRYHPSRRNPWNEVECGDHYARAMASYGVFLAACGYEYHGPKGHLGFAPRLTPDDFRAAFTTAEGWGTFTQKRSGQAQRHSLTLAAGRLRLRTLAFATPDSLRPAKATLSLNGKPLPATLTAKPGRAEITLADELLLQAGERLEIVLDG